MSQQINLFNPIFLKQEKQFSALTMVQALGIILVCGILLTLYTRYELGRLQAQQEAIAAQVQLAQDQLAKVTVEYGPRKKDPALALQLHRTERELQSLQQISDVMLKGEFGNTKGYSEYMRAFARQITGGIWLTGFTIQGAGNDISIQGSALRPDEVPAYLNRLKREPVMAGASFATLEMQLPKPVEGKNGTADKQPAVPPYIDFSLHSSAAAGKSGAAQ